MSDVNRAIVACARSWLGTRFHHQGRVKRTARHAGGVDCLGLLVGIANELHLKDSEGCHLSGADERNYSHQPDTHYLKGRLATTMEQVDICALQPGHILLLRIDSSPQHLAVVSDIGNQFGIIHAYAPARAVVEHQLDRWWLEKIDSVFQVIHTY